MYIRIFMSREQVLHGIILKKQAFGETDELVTVYTSQQGKVRLKARGVKKATSKLQYSLQALSQVELRVAGSAIPTVVGTHVLDMYPKIRERAELVTLFFWIAELVVKAMADEQQNSALYSLMCRALAFLNTSPERITPFKAAFALQFLDAVGLSVLLVADASDNIYFSNSAGGFTISRTTDAVPVSRAVAMAARAAREPSFELLVDYDEGYDVLFRLLLDFLSYQLERKIHSGRFVAG
jgi:DNA repair protein RecO